MIIHPQPQILEARVPHRWIESHAYTDLTLAFRGLKFLGKRYAIERKLIGCKLLVISDQNYTALLRIKRTRNVRNAIAAACERGAAAKPVQALNSLGRDTCG